MSIAGVKVASEVATESTFPSWNRWMNKQSYQSSKSLSLKSFHLMKQQILKGRVETFFQNRLESKNLKTRKWKTCHALSIYQSQQV